jgi:homoaconitase/3-isopropylmalate dehydratase large subunit
MRGRRRVPVALQASADRDEAYVGSCTRVVASDLNEAVDIAELGLAASPIVDALKIPADFDAGADKPALL